MLCNKELHEIRGPLDRGAHGECVECVRDRGRRHAAVRSEAVALYRALADRNVTLDADHLAEGHRLVTAIDMARNVEVGI